MQQTGLQNRFDEKDRFIWQFWYACLVCGKNNWDALHHIISPTHPLYVGGEHNKSILNSCPIHNFGCHIGNNDVLRDSTRLLLNRSKDILLNEQGYKLNERDNLFLKIYAQLYDEI